MTPTKQAIGIDIGGTKISLGVVNEAGRIIAQTTLPTEPRQGFESAVARINQAIRQILESATCSATDLSGIGIGCPGPLNPFTGVINNDYTLPTWGGCNIVQALQAEFDLPVHLENDADAALLGEAFAGAGRGASHLVMLTFGTGVGGAVLADGKIYRGANGEHPEIGHVPIEPAGPACYCGLNGCLESIASGSAIAKVAQAAGFADAQDAFSQSTAGNQHAQAIITRAINATATALWTLIHTFLPERVIFGGGIMEAHYPLFLLLLQAVINKATMKPSTGIQLRQAELGNQAGLVGAGFLALRKRLRK